MGLSTSWVGRRVLVTGHTGFKGTWLSLWLCQKGADVFGLALAPDTEPALFDQIGLAGGIDHGLGDVRTPETVRGRLEAVRPDVVFHLAAQPLVRRSYREPVETWSTNVMGTVHLLEGLRGWDKPCAVVVVTTDKVYENRERLHAYRETDRLGGHDPYSASKAACELVVDSYRKSFFANGPMRLASARAGNVIGGGDWAEDRILPDLARAFALGRPLSVRNPQSIRPWQHVLDPLSGYICLAERLWSGDHVAETAFNFGPAIEDQRSVQSLVDEARNHWEGDWQDESDHDAPHEAGRLSLSTEKACTVLDWAPRWHFSEAVKRTIQWYRAVHEGADPRYVTLAQIAEFEAATQE